MVARGDKDRKSRQAGSGSKSAILSLQSYSSVQCGSGVFFKMAALITSVGLANTRDTT